MTGAYDGLTAGDFADVLEVRINNVEEFERAFNEAVANALMEIGMAAEGYAKARCPVDTGRLRLNAGPVYDRRSTSTKPS